MSNLVAQFSILPDWEEADGVRAPELRATWARLEIWAGSECITQVEERGSRVARRGIYVSAYPLAEWLTYNWWFLKAHVRPAGLGPRSWTFPALGHSSRNRWLNWHNLRGSGEGLPWPNLTILPEGGLTRLVWYRDPQFIQHHRVRFISEGEAWLIGSQFENDLAAFIEAVITRLDEEGIDQTPLTEEWRSLKQTDSDEADFCIAAARLGLDPYAVSPHLAAGIEESAQQLSEPILEDFFNAVDPLQLDAGLQWVQETISIIRNSSGAGGDLIVSLRSAIEQLASGLPSPESPLPWQVGWSQARMIRDLLDLEPQQTFEFDSSISVVQNSSPDKSLQAVGGVSASESYALVAGRPLRLDSTRFAKARALWHFLYETEERNFLLTNSHSLRQMVERAFAAELLAPAEGIRAQLGSAIPDQEDVLNISSHFGVSDWIVRHQLSNQLDIEVPDL